VSRNFINFSGNYATAREMLAEVYAAITATVEVFEKWNKEFSEASQ